MGKDGVEKTNGWEARLYCNSKRKLECIICRIKIEMPIRMTIMSMIVLKQNERLVS